MKLLPLLLEISSIELSELCKGLGIDLRKGRFAARFSKAPMMVCLLFIHPRAPNLINLRSASTMPA